MTERETPPGTAGAPAAPYVVLARKYRPATFDDLIGQEAMVTTLKNAFATDRIAQGYMLTGVRGVGKTTTARILARALNYEREGVEKPTFDMPEPGRHCAEIMEGRHPDVIEMDAASNTGVDNMREIIESARYKPLIARYKVYLIDEVHMLSKGAFNALLKTLEEPPRHVKFIFATTEVRKVPVTVLSRCQRFDLRRVDVPVLMRHFKGIVAKEGGTARDDDGLALIARASQGSVRDGLSLLDQALAMGSGAIEAANVRAMLGLADRGRIFDLVERLLAGTAPQALELFAELHRDGAEPLADPERPGGGGAHRHPRQGAGCRGGRRGPLGRGAAPRRRPGRTAVDAPPGTRLADPAQGPRGGCRGAQRHGRGRDGADPAGLHRGPAPARRDPQGAGRWRHGPLPARRPRAGNVCDAARHGPPAGPAPRWYPSIRRRTCGCRRSPYALGPGSRRSRRHASRGGPSGGAHGGRPRTTSRATRMWASSWRTARHRCRSCRLSSMLWNWWV